jgi:hypothetical protein
VLENVSRSMFATQKYCYVISAEEFYDIGAKDVFKVALSDVCNPEVLSYLGVRFGSEELGEMASPEFEHVRALMHYAFAVRLPFLRMVLPFKIRDRQLAGLFNEAKARGADNYGEIIDETYRDMLKLSRHDIQPEFSSEWFRRWVYTCGRELAAINNRNLFLFGCADACFPLYYAALTEKLTALFANNSK